MKTIKIESTSNFPKYKQIVKAVEKAIEEKRLNKNDKLPSVNKIALEYNISRDTILLAYDELKKRGIIYAILGKGYYVKSVDFSFEQLIFLLFDELNIFKEDIYNAFLACLDNRVQVDIFFHNFNIDMFRKLCNESNGTYSKYIIMPSNLVGTTPIIKSLPKNEVYILDQTNEDLKDYPSIHQNFIKDMFQGLTNAYTLLKKYNQLILVFPGKKEPIGMVHGFLQFCEQNTFSHQIITDFDNHTIQHKTVYIIPSDRDLVTLIEQAKTNNLQLGKDYGIISYNETPLKKVVENGITTISTDFSQMGVLLAQMILQPTKLQMENTSQLIIRNSI